MQAIHASLAVVRQLEQWLRDESLPWWATEGTDRANGGFFERFDREGTPLEEPRRSRVVARQIYVFATAKRHGWCSVAEDRVHHGLRFLLDRLRLPDGTFAASFDVQTSRADPRFDLYEQAFAMFCLAAAYRVLPDLDNLVDVAHELLIAIKQKAAHPDAGFHSTQPHGTRLHANPQMHLLEAALEWESIGPSNVMFDKATSLADELAELALDKLIDPTTGTLLEYFDTQWRALPARDGQIVEPGHQFEWAWLLFEWGSRRSRPDAISAAEKLVKIGEGFGVDWTRGVAVNSLHADLSTLDSAAKLWPQTERIKAWCSMVRRVRGGSNDHESQAWQGVTDACLSLRSFIKTAPRGRWHEVWHSDGSFSAEPTRASSLYHVVCAIDVAKSLARLAT